MAEPTADHPATPDEAAIRAVLRDHLTARRPPLASWVIDEDIDHMLDPALADCDLRDIIRRAWQYALAPGKWREGTAGER